VGECNEVISLDTTFYRNISAFFYFETHPSPPPALPTHVFDYVFAKHIPDVIYSVFR
jgi:hypothetical protein